ncbi:hypothetical protein MRX96_049073, partial [Rhipicephalus microplus]
AAKKKSGLGPVHFAEICPGVCDDSKVEKECWPNCECRVLDEIDPPIYMCFERGKSLPMGFH